MAQKFIISSLALLFVITNCVNGRVLQNPAPRVSLLPPLPPSVPVPFNKVHMDDAYYFLAWNGDLELDGAIQGLDALVDNVSYHCGYGEAHFNFQAPSLLIAGSFNVTGTETYSDTSVNQWWTIKGPGTYSLTLEGDVSFEAYGRVVSGADGKLRFDTNVFYTTPRLPEAVITRENLVVESSESLSDAQVQQTISDFLSFFSVEVQKAADDNMRVLLDGILEDYTLAEFLEVTGTQC